MLARAKPAFNSSQGPVLGLILAHRPTDCQDDENQRFPGLSCTRSRPPSALVLELLIDRCNHGSSTSAPAINTRPIRAGLGSPDKRNRRVSRLWRHGDRMLPASTCSANNFGPRPLTQPSRLASSWTVPSTLALDTACWPAIYPSMPQHAGKLALSHGPAPPTLPPALGAGRTRDFLWADRIPAPSLTRLPPTRHARLGRSSLRPRARYRDRLHRRAPKPTEAVHFVQFAFGILGARWTLNTHTGQQEMRPWPIQQYRIYPHLVSLCHLTPVTRAGISAEGLRSEEAINRLLLDVGPVFGLVLDPWKSIGGFPGLARVSAAAVYV